MPSANFNLDDLYPTTKKLLDFVNSLRDENLSSDEAFTQEVKLLISMCHSVASMMECVCRASKNDGKEADTVDQDKWHEFAMYIRAYALQILQREGVIYRAEEILQKYEGDKWRDFKRM